MLHVTVICFLGSYLVAFALEVGRLWGRSRASRLVMIGFGVAGFVAHTIYLLNRSQQTHLPPLLASTYDWMLVLAWVLVLCYLFLSVTHTELAVGLFLLPVVLLLVASTYFLSQEPNTAMNAERARRNWGMLHASLLVFGIAAGAAGFVSGLMYLFQHRRLKTRHGEHTGLKMPSLARLAQANRWSVMLAFLLLTLGFASGIILALLPGTSTVKLADPAVVTSALVWLILAGVFVKLLSHHAPSGRQVAWLTICGCGFLLLTLIGLQVVTGNVHSYSEPESGLRPADAGSSDFQSGGTPIGVRAISRGLSEATPPVWTERETAPRRGASLADSNEETRRRNAATPSGPGATRDEFSGGVAALNPRLIAEAPYGVVLRTAATGTRHDLLFALRGIAQPNGAGCRRIAHGYFGRQGGPHG